MCQINTLYSLHLHNVICQLLINKADNKETTLEKQNDFLFYYGVKKPKIF